MVSAEVRVGRCTGRRPLEAGVLRAYLDQELAPARQQAVAGHVASCAACAASVARLETTARLVARRFVVLDAAGVGAPIPAMSAALVATLDRAWRPGKGLGGSLGSGWSGLLERLLWPAPYRRPLVRVVMGAAVLALALAAFAQPAVRSAADAVVQRFRVQRFQVVQVDVQALAAQMEQMRTLAPPHPGELGAFHGAAEPRLRSVTGREEAARLAGLAVRLPGRLPAGVPNQPSLFVVDPVQFTFTYDGQKATAAARNWGVHDPVALAELARLDGLTVRGDIPATVLALYGEVPGLGHGAELRGERPAAGAQPAAMVLAQVRSPSAEVLGEVDLDALRRQLLEIAPLPPGLAQQLLGITDWRMTFPVPVTRGTGRDVAVDGTIGVLVTGEGTGPQLVWQRDGILYAIIGFGVQGEGAVLEAARSLR